MNSEKKMYLFLFVVFILGITTSNSLDCGSGHLPCKSGGECIESNKWCDETDNCADGSDEVHCKKKNWWNSDPNDCLESDSLFLCDTGICIPKAAVCNNHNDCKDNSDEEDCGTSAAEDINTTPKVGQDLSTQVTTQLATESDYDDEDYDDEDEDESTSQTNIFPREKVTTTSSSRVPTRAATQIQPDVTSNIDDYYKNRMKENEVETSETATLIPPRESSFEQPSVQRTTPLYKSTPSTTRTPRAWQTSSSATIPTTARSRAPFDNRHSTPRGYDYGRRGYDYNRRGSDNNQRTDRTATPDRYPQNVNRRDSQNNRPPPTYDSRVNSQDRRSQTYDQRIRTQNGQSPPSYDRRSQTHDQRIRTQNGQPSSYDTRSHAHENNLNSYNTASRHGAYPDSQIHGVHPSIFVHRQRHSNRHRDQHHPYDGRANSEQDWREAATLRTFHRETQINEPFHFAKNYVSRDNNRHVKDAQDWLMGIRNNDGDWGKDTARAIIALGLANNTFRSGNTDSELMKKNFIVQLSVNLIRNDTQTFTVNQLATSMNALLSVCENPRDFHGMNLTQSLRVRIREQAKKRAIVNPFVYLALCLSGSNLTSAEIHHLMKQMRPAGALQEITKDTQSVAVQAFACYLHQQTAGSSDHAYQMSLRETLHSAVTDLVQRMDDEGSFGSVYSTALAAQALMSVNDSAGWASEKTTSFLRSQQQEDGSFGDLLATYYALPVLAGRSLLHLRNLQCDEPPTIRDLAPAEILEFVGRKQYIHYSIYFGDPLENSHSIRVLVPVGINFFDVMRVAQYQDSNFRFVYHEQENNIQVYSLSGVPNDFERGLSWHLYLKQESDPRQQTIEPRERYVGDLRQFLPSAGQHVVFWYHPIRLYK